MARLWRRIPNAELGVIFGSESFRRVNRELGDRLAQPGYIGQRYRPGGLVFVSMNPGAGPQDGLSTGDQNQYAALQRLRDADESAALAAFGELTQVLADIMPGWKIHRNFGCAPAVCGWR